MERLILQALDYHLIAPSSSTFLHRYLRAGESDMFVGDSELSCRIANLSKVQALPLVPLWCYCFDSVVVDTGRWLIGHWEVVHSSRPRHVFMSAAVSV